MSRNFPKTVVMNDKSFWWFSTLSGKPHCSWKIHCYGESFEDWWNYLTKLIPRLENKHINFKIVNKDFIDTLKKHPTQKGKMVVIYPKSIEQMKILLGLLERDLEDWIGNSEGLDMKIIGDRQYGGRVFYRYELKSGKYADKIFNRENYNEYHNLYDPNRGDDKYLASDMTEADDPFIK